MSEKTKNQNVRTTEQVQIFFVIRFFRNQDDHFSVIEFAYNNNYYHANIKMTMQYRRKYRSPLGWFEVGKEKLLGPDLVHQEIENV